MSFCWVRLYGYGRCLLVGEEYILILILILVLVLVLLLLKTFFVCPPACRRRLFFQKKDVFWKNIFLILWKMLKNTTFELLDHHHELNQKKLIFLKLFMLKIDSTMLKLWSNPFFRVYFDIFRLLVLFWMSNIFLNV